MFQRNIPPPSSGLKMEAVQSPVMSMDFFYRITWQYIPEDGTFHIKTYSETRDERWTYLNLNIMLNNNIIIVINGILIC
jgi:hypothetical protein